MNSITIAGNISQTAELRHLPNGDAVASFSIADNQGKDKKAIFHRCSLFGKRAESLLPYLQSGQAVTVTGSITERPYTNKDGVEVIARDIRVNDVALQGKPQGGAAPAPKGRDRDAYTFPGSDDSDPIPF